MAQILVEMSETPPRTRQSDVFEQLRRAIGMIVYQED